MPQWGWVMKKRKPCRILNVLLLLSVCFVLSLTSSFADDQRGYESESSSLSMMGPTTLWQNPRDCGEMGVWDVAMVMCMPLASPEMPMSMIMIHGNLFGSRVWQSGARRRSDSFSTNTGISTSPSNRRGRSIRATLCRCAASAFISADGALRGVR